MLRLEIMTPTGAVLTEQVEAVVIPGELGEFNVLSGHTPFLAATQPGLLVYSQGSAQRRIAVGRGFAEVGADDHVLVLTQESKRAEDVDAAELQGELDHARLAIEQWEGPLEGEDGAPDPNYRALEDRVRWAEACLALE